ncbi:Hint domain-containing protein [Chelatococcus reniformis]|uniref:Hedgehog/Intein (Hint) domain-containing protein n=1 Tax=Chelatococcus reniformis TaxID=1494448 RepID=A0A916XEE2_9HYPH|nr:Hint domain-containing protein [Chelatococcus reniformis]GGC67846.1 hypothetical protein GCM10010994_28030 [Chelatococcus reniformis]
MTDKAWIGDDAGNGDWSNAANWDPPGVPGAADAVFINGGRPTIAGDVGAVASLSLSAQLALDGGVIQVSGTFANAGALTLANSSNLGCAQFDNVGAVTIGNGSTLYSGNVNNGGPIEIDAGGVLYADGGYSSLGSIDVRAGGLLQFEDLPLALAELTSGDIANNGTIAIGVGVRLDLADPIANQTLDLASVGSLTVNGGTIANGTIVDDGTTALTLQGATFEAMTYRGELDIGFGSLTVVGGLTVHDEAGVGPGTLNVDGGSIVIDGQTLDGMTINLFNAGLFALNAPAVLAAGVVLSIPTDAGSFLAGEFISHGQIDVLAGSLLSFETLDNEGEVLVGAGATLTGNALVNDGSITVANASLSLSGDLGGGGTLTLAGAATVTLNGGTASEQTVALIDGELRLLTPSAFEGLIDDFNDADDAIDLLGVPFDAGDTVTLLSGNLLEITQTAGEGGGVITLRLSPSEDYSRATFLLADDGEGGTDITVAVCFCAGTGIATPDGERPVETLAAGDLVTTAAGVARPIRWIGRQTVAPAFADPMRQSPIRISAGALDERMPVRDLYVSPEHALLVDGVLAQAGALVNGTTVRRMPRPTEPFIYYHIELDDHALVLADGTPAETFVDNVTRRRFDNHAEYEALFGPPQPRIPEMELPRAKSARQLPRAVRERLGRRAEALGLWRRAAA